MMKSYGEEGSPYCCFHPGELVVGICALCLRERLIDLASSKQPLLLLRKDTRRSSSSGADLIKRRPAAFLPKVFALLHLIEPPPPPPPPRELDDSSDDEGSNASLEGSFISIKFEENGHPSWDKKRATSAQQVKSLVEQPKRNGALRWRRRIGQLLQLARWKRSNKASTCRAGFAAAGKVEEGIKGRRGWIRSLSRRRTTTTTSTD